MASRDSEQHTGLMDDIYDDPSQLSQLLRQRAGNPDTYQASDATGHSLFISPSKPAAIAASANERTSFPDNHNHSPQRVNDTTALTRNAPSRRAPADVNYVKPNLPTHNTAPASESALKPRERVDKMYQTFSGVMDGPGDTQPDSQIYKEWTSGIYGSAVHENVPTHGFGREEHDQGADSLSEPQDAVNSSQEQLSPTVTSPTIAPEDENINQFQHDSLAPTSPLKFETPAMAGRKRTSDGQMLSSDLRTVTPGTTLTAAAFFGGGSGGIKGMGNAMSLTQVFNATQAHTSPIVEGVSDDAVFQRPSPNFTDARNSSPVPVLPTSSPIKAVHLDPLRSSSEPRAAYVTMKQSQDKRSRVVTTREHDHTEQESWDEPSITEKRALARSARHKLDRETGKTFAQVTAPSSSPPQGRRKLRSIPSAGKLSRLRTPATSRSSRRNAYDGPYDCDEVSSNEPSQQNAATVARIEANAINELSQDEHSSSLGGPDLGTRVQVPNTSSHPIRTLSGRSTRNTPPASPSLRSERNPHSRPVNASRDVPPGSPEKSSKETETIMDSQPDSRLYAQPTSRPKSLLPPSSPSTNQYSIDQTTLARNTGYTSRVVSSSVLSMPPKSSTQSAGNTTDAPPDNVDNDDRVPSSPPAMSVDEVVYDEHDYGEHQSAGEDEVDVRSGDSDTADEDEDLPQVGHNVIVDEDQSLREPSVGSDAIPESESVVDEGSGMNVDHPDEANVNKRHDDGHGRSDEPSCSSPTTKGLSSPMHQQDQPPSRMHRQSTIPESDVMEDQQGHKLEQTVAAVDIQNDQVRESTATGDSVSRQTNSTENFHTAHENQSITRTGVSGSNTIDTNRDEGKQGRKLRSLSDIANQASTQQSNIGDVEIPTLSGLSFSEDIGDKNEVSSAEPSFMQEPVVKKRKITYKSKATRISPSKNDRQESQDAHSLERPEPQVHNVTEPDEVSAIQHDSPAKDASREGALKPAKKTTMKPPAKEVLSRASPRNRAPKKSSERARTIPETPKTDAPASRFKEGEEQAAPIEETTNQNEEEEPSGDILVPNRVIAYWPSMGFYPATCLGAYDSRHLKIRYDDGTLNSLEAIQVRTMQLRVGDQVKVDVPGIRKNIYVVAGFKDKLDTESLGDFPLTDQYGHLTIVLKLKQSSTEEPISVPMEKMYLTNQLWGKFGDRLYTFAASRSSTPSASRVGTPAATVEEPITPSLLRRSHTGLSLLKELPTRAMSVSSSNRSSSVFANMAFATTSTQDSSGDYRNGLATLITNNGGQILEEGFHELFTATDSSGEPSATNKQQAASSSWDGLLVKEEYKGLRLVALITDSHCRSTKFIQALALNVPCLHDRWLTDSIKAGMPLNFSRYLLPAGTSIYLQGAVRSRIMPLYDPASEEASLSKMVQERELLLKGQNILLVTGKSKREAERKKPFIFLTYALSPKVVGRCTDIASAVELLQDGRWDWIYVDGGKAGVDETAATLFGDKNQRRVDGATAPKTKQGKKRKQSASNDRDDKGKDSTDSLIRKGEVGGRTIRIVCDEFIVQSLILGALAEE
ncbi:hypothetical protein BU24DRAFT_416749 [Aaosphaeria arxii CBS 175.79]|uniref:BRCT domain-containing protein n=1 Tax=Aaosphaeria arxii CBS 175.79 TaxID=1450172 RepID=A0A6A5Y6A1_9PLEO|nr:uncharacterized protein BU24DRAFT_416749 [Aaosphaeria arxii CBS 175.79]KAF2021082.1 hypothetical protein BU24DRAFT_416749 [Aaosphaeria arxii CBS 175.79]